MLHLHFSLFKVPSQEEESKVAKKQYFPPGNIRYGTQTDRQTDGQSHILRSHNHYKKRDETAASCRNDDVLSGSVKKGFTGRPHRWMDGWMDGWDSLLYDLALGILFSFPCCFLAVLSSMRGFLCHSLGTVFVRIYVRTYACNSKDVWWQRYAGFSIGAVSYTHLTLPTTPYV